MGVRHYDKAFKEQAVKLSQHRPKIQLHQNERRNHPERISELENLFEINRDNAKIRQMNKNVEDYERAVKTKATLDEQARLRQLEAERLDKEADSIKGK